ncbi:partial Serine/threonine-protein kinase B, partial [Gammaproteobacteria bacterium]
MKNIKADRQLWDLKFFTRLQKTLSYWVPAIGFVVALILAVTVGIPTGFDIGQYWQYLEPTERAKAGIELIQVMALIVGGIAIFWNIAIARRQLEASQEQNVTARFSKAVEQLGSELLSIRVGAIYSLGRIAKSHPTDNWSIMEILAIFIRERRGLPVGERLATDEVKIDRDVQAAIIAIGQREAKGDLEAEPLFLSYTDLRKICFAEDNYCNMRFHCSDLRGANFYAANLQRTKFWRASLAEAVLFRANFKNADLVDADFRGADMKECILAGADIEGAKFEGARNLAAEQVKLAKNWQKA